MTSLEYVQIVHICKNDTKIFLTFLAFLTGGVVFCYSRPTPTYVVNMVTK